VTEEKCDHVWSYTCLGMYRHCWKCRKTQGNHVQYGWVDLLFRDDEAYAIKTPNGDVETLEKGKIVEIKKVLESECAGCDKKKLGR